MHELNCVREEFEVVGVLYMTCRMRRHPGFEKPARSPVHAAVQPYQDPTVEAASPFAPVSAPRQGTAKYSPTPIATAISTQTQVMKAHDRGRCSLGTKSSRDIASSLAVFTKPSTQDLLTLEVFLCGRTTSKNRCMSLSSRLREVQTLTGKGGRATFAPDFAPVIIKTMSWLVDSHLHRT